FYDLIDSLIYDIDLKENQRILKFSYTLEDGIHIYGKYYIPQDISEEKANRLVEESKATWVYNEFEGLKPITVDARPITPTNLFGAGRPRHRGLRAGTTGAKVSGAKRTLTGQLLSKTFGPEIWQVGAVESVTIPYEIENIETGITVQAELVDKLLPDVSKALTPVSSSNVRGIGTWNNELLIQFHPNKLTPMRTYRYNLNTPEGAQEAFQSLLTSGSPGRWVWRFIRGHNKGETVTSRKKAPSLSPPGKGLPTIGGTSASLLPYKISNRTPTGRIAKFEELSRKLKKHITPSPFTDPETGSRVEGYLGAVRGFRDLGLKRLDCVISLITKDFIVPAADILEIINVRTPTGV
ncbi:MAG: hypothetical protein KAX33_12265, partial [Candidatus Lokiarchaeota archaeon]|nr:hypothetical protein [Candidatus Lokiarchaeota archaeon]